MGTISNYLTDISIMTYLVVFLGGLAVSFTPCVYPLIPIILGVVGSSRNKSRGRNFILSFSYVLGLALTFSILGLAAAMTGRLFGQFQSSLLVQIIAGSIIILFGLVLLDVVPLPTFWLNKIGVGKVKRGSSIPLALLMGALSGLIAAPCATAVLGALLAYVAAKQNIIFGFTLLFTFATGLGMLLLIIGSFSGILSALPKSAKWAQIIQKVIALALIILGGYLILGRL